jgi:hypothetical protein
LQRDQRSNQHAGAREQYERRPSCNSALQGAVAIVSDGLSPTWHGAYAGNGAITSGVICSYNGSSYGWLFQ